MSMEEQLKNPKRSKQAMNGGKSGILYMGGRRTGLLGERVQIPILT
jgi:hypothetical protein